MDIATLNALIRDLRRFFLERTDVDAAAVFGSVARGEDTDTSDVDILVVSDVPELFLNAELRPMARRYGKPFNASVFEPGELQLMMNKNSVIRAILHSPMIPSKGRCLQHNRHCERFLFLHQEYWLAGKLCGVAEYGQLELPCNRIRWSSLYGRA